MSLLIVVVLLFFSAFFVATEFAIIRVRPSRVDQLVLEGRKNALAVRKVTSNLDGYLSACQLGITITSLGLGWLGEPAVEKMLYPLMDRFGIQADLGHVASFLIAFFIITYLHVVLGELAPKTLAIQKAEKVSFFVARPIIWFYRIAYPLIWLLNGSANMFVRWFGLSPASEQEEAHSEEEIRIILNESFQSGKINNTEYGYVSRIFNFDDLLAREIMVPRTDMVCLYADKPLEENIRIIKKEQYTRFPVALENKDNIVGTINTKQLFLNYDKEGFDLKSIMRPAMSVPEVMPVKTLLKRMQQERVHIAILLDEYGGTAGMITIEDILEEIVGDIRDEFDADEKKEIEKTGENRYLVDGKALLWQVNDVLDSSLEHDDVDTIGGWLYNMNPDMAAGDKLEYGGLTFIIREMGLHRIKKVEIIVNESKEE
ncbi:membrane protein [Paenibacillus sp. 32O-W]|uniref:hemolysin family protein n=1 Tax=Paenibacillus sp. 32O-W TaxID=1695218 RepID=UPI0007223334|nr:hemolysin family protein [Paenibacillus sp. 32O-W]ALS29687.1 membrane protein [Paenibacillus sp. 32O-W]